MRVCLEWLSDFIDIGDRSVENISRSLSLSGTEVERIEYPWAGLEGAVVGRIESVYVHPAGDRLLVTGVNTGERTLSIVTSDTSVKAGETVAVLPEGSLFDGKAIAAREFSGVRSEGMFLSLQELELEERSLHIMRLECARVGEDLKSLLRLDSPVIEVELTANRGDCLSMIGLAREVGAVLGLKTGRPPVENDIDTGEDPVLKVALNDTGCRRYSALLMDGVKIAPSPLWLKRRLVAAGLRPINNVVDITNYVMLETGHPIHAFDVDRIGSTKILVRNARNGEELELLDGRKVELNESDLLITNGETPLALAGIMGGEDSGIDVTTDRVLLEVAVFDPVRIRKTARRLGISTDSSYRFERGVDYTDSIYVLKRLAGLMEELCRGRVASKIVDVGRIENPEGISLRKTFVTERLGKELPDGEIERILTGLEFGVERRDGGWIVTPPAFRAYDTTQEVDLVEEIGRIYGYDRIDDELPRILPVSIGVPGYLKRQRKLKELMVANGFDEIISYSFMNPDEIRKVDEEISFVPLQNPLSMDMAVMRPSMVFGMLSAASYNFRRQNRDLKLFEIGSIFSPETGRREYTAVGFAAMGRENPLDFSDKRAIDFFTVKGVIEELFSLFGASPRFGQISRKWLEQGKAVSVIMDGREVGFFGAFSRTLADSLYDIKSGELYVGELNLTLIDSMRNEFTGSQRISPFPRVSRDLSFLVPSSLAYSELEGIIESSLEGTSFSEIRVSDIYRGKGVEQGFTSVTVTLDFESFERTLTDDEVNDCIAKVLDATSRAGVKLRG